ncbi:MAG: Peptidase S1 and S6 chymotrypsin/Hap [Parcubacteria group bacterium GW2011_GWC2_52_8c]|nr:MAG: Peptidase S1 and S6 chymotrypsin/Hap [Parcubacteria group bacterium GW2011_GWC2_52_8c]
MIRRLVTISFIIVFGIFSGIFWRQALTGRPVDTRFAPTELRILQEMFPGGQAQNAKPLAALESEVVSGASVSGLIRPEELNTKDVPSVPPKNHKTPPVSSPAAVSGVIPQAPAAQQLTPDEIYQKLYLAVVQVVCEQGAGSVSTGSGVIVSPKGIVLTNAHVVDGAKSCVVKTGNPASFAGKLKIVFVGDTSDKIATSPVPKQDFAFGRIYELTATSPIISPFKYLELNAAYSQKIGDGLYSAAYPTELIGGSSLLAGGQNLVYTTTKIVERYRVDDASNMHDIIELEGSIATQQGSSGSPIISPLGGGVVGIVFGQTNAEIENSFGLPSKVATGERTELAFLISYIDRTIRKQKGKSLGEFIEELGAL